MFMIDMIYHIKGFLFFGIVTSLSVFQKIIIRIRIYVEMLKKPSDSKKVLVFMNEPVSRQPVSFAKNAAAFLGKVPLFFQFYYILSVSFVTTLV